MLYIISPGLIDFITGSLYFLTTFTCFTPPSASGQLPIYLVSDFGVFFFFFGYIHVMWKFLGQGSVLCHNSDNPGSLTTRPPGNFFLKFIIYYCNYFASGLHLWHMEVPRLGIRLELQLLAYTTTTAPCGSEPRL